MSAQVGTGRPFLLLATRAEDAVADAEYDQFLRYGRLPAQRLHRVRLESAPLAELLPELDLTRYAGVLVGGSPFTSSDPESAKSPTQLRVERELAGLVEAVLKHDVPFLGACYGIATLGRFVGGTVDTTYGEPVGAVRVTLTAEGAADPLLAGLAPGFDAFVGHKEALRAVPPGATLLASSPGCPVQMFRVGRHQYATQFHPELDVEGIAGRIRAYRDCGYFAPEEMDELLQRVRATSVHRAGEVLAAFTHRYG